MRVVGLDLSLTGSGVAIIQTWQNGNRSVDLSEYSAPKPKVETPATRAHRLRSIASQVYPDCRGADLVAIEDLYMGAGTGAQLDRAGLWWIIVNSLCAQGIPVAVVTNNHLKMYATGKGAGKGTDKDHVLAAVIKRYPTVDVTSNNTADALVLAAMAARYLGSPLEPDDFPTTHLRAMNAVHWPTTR